MISLILWFTLPSGAWMIALITLFFGLAGWLVKVQMNLNKDIFLNIANLKSELKQHDLQITELTARHIRDIVDSNKKIEQSFLSLELNAAKIAAVIKESTDKVEQRNAEDHRRIEGKLDKLIEKK
jgi:hypothetical protein